MIWLFDSGHGGITSGQYNTAPLKMYKFSEDKIAYEGVINRRLKEELIKLNKGNLNYIDVSSGELDLPLDLRVDYANMLHREYGNCIYCSLHSNAGKGTGFEIWTSIGQTSSDKHAHYVGKFIQADFPTIPFRKDTSDGDLDKESQFYVLKYTKCPAWLLENLFFDNELDYEYLKSDTYIKKLAGSIFKYQIFVEKYGL